MGVIASLGLNDTCFFFVKLLVHSNFYLKYVQSSGNNKDILQTEHFQTGIASRIYAPCNATLWQNLSLTAAAVGITVFTVWVENPSKVRGEVCVS